MAAKKHISRVIPKGKEPPKAKKQVAEKERSFLVRTPAFLEPAGRRLDAMGSRCNEAGLIRWDRKSIGFIGLLAVVFIILVSCRIHYSSIGIWDEFIKGNSAGSVHSSVIAGSPKMIRMDEWRVVTPYMVSQAVKGFPVENYSLGTGKVPLVMNLPAHHFSSIFQPQNWGFFILPIEHGFSFLWNYRLFGLIISTFLFLMLTTGNKFWLSACGAAFLFFSSFIQWWFSVNIGEYITSMNFILVLAIYLVFSQKLWKIIVSGILLFFFLMNFSLLLYYPPYQVSLGLLMIALLAGYLVSKWNKEIVKNHLSLRMILIAGIVIVAGYLLFLFYKDIRETINITLNTVYPGKRRCTGGGFGWDRFFSGFFSIFMNEKKFIWINICETSSFIFLFPVVVVAVAVNFFRKKREPLLIALSLFLLFLTIYTVYGFPAFLSGITLLSFVPSERAIIGIGIANIYLIILFLAKEEFSFKLSAVLKTVMALLFIIILFIFGRYLSDQHENLFDGMQIAVVAVVFGIASLLLLTGKRLPALALVLIMAIASTYYVFPITNGMGFFFDKKIYSGIHKIVEKDSKGKWLVYSDAMMPAFLMTTGADVFDGTKYTPNLPAMNLIDDGKTNEAIYNRYAFIIAGFPQQPGKTDFQKFSEDAYLFTLSPSSDKLKKLGIRYLVIPVDYGNFTVEKGKRFGLIPVYDSPVDGFWIVRNDGPLPTNQIFHE
jgi:hypothetical protein